MTGVHPFRETKRLCRLRASARQTFFANPRFTRAYLAHRKSLHGATDSTKIISEDRDLGGRVIYFDTSYLVRLYYQDPDADAVRALAATDHVASAALGQAEMAAFHRKLREGAIRPTRMLTC